jgi:hypothetical protein
LGPGAMPIGTTTITPVAGAIMIDREYCVLVNSSSKENVTVARLNIGNRLEAGHGAK